MPIIVDKEVLKSGLIIFRRGDVAYRNFYCRIRLPQEDRYKTIALQMVDPQSARDQAFAADIRFRIKHDGLVFDIAHLTMTKIRDDQIYGGVRPKTVAFLENARIPITVDVGTGDGLTDLNHRIDYP